MKSRTTFPPISNLLGAVVWLGSAVLATAASTVVSFQVDMSNALFDPATQTVAARGAFGGPGTTWSILGLTNNPSGPAPGLWSGTTNVAFDSGVLSYKYSIEPGTNFETVVQGGNHNRLALMPGSSASALLLPKVFFGDSAPNPVTVTVTFQVNMAQQFNTGAFDTTSSVYARGVFNGWAQDLAMTNDPSILTTNSFGLVSSNVYAMSYSVTGSPGQTTDFKFYIDKNSNWESPPASVGDPVDNNNRFFNLADAATQIVGPVYFNESAYAPAVTNHVTFQVDMTAQILNGSFDPSSGSVEVRGNFNGWGTPQILCTNNPSAQNTNLYSAVVTITDGVNALEQYKFFATVPANGGWETMANNRTFNLANTNSQILPAAFFNDLNPADLLPLDTVVAFQVNMTGAVGTDSHPFNPASDQVFINGLPAGTFAAWDNSLPQLTNNPVGSSIYSLDVLIPKGSPLQQVYKYGINGVDDEAAAGSNHIRYIRATGTYTMPLDIFGNLVVESAVGNLQTSRLSANHILLTWLGGTGVHLQTSSGLNSGPWTDHPETAGLTSTNWPISGQALFFRLIKPGLSYLPGLPLPVDNVTLTRLNRS